MKTLNTETVKDCMRALLKADQAVHKGVHWLADGAISPRKAEKFRKEAVEEIDYAKGNLRDAEKTAATEVLQMFIDSLEPMLLKLESDVMRAQGYETLPASLKM